MPLMDCMPLMKAESARPSLAVCAPAPGALKRSENWSAAVADGDRPLIAYWPLASVVTVPSSTLLRSTSTVQPCSGASPESDSLLRLVSCHTRPLRLAVPGVPPTAMEALAEAVRRSEEHTSELQSRYVISY